MTVQIKHATLFNGVIADNPDAFLNPSEWDEAHTVAQTAAGLIGATGAGDSGVLSATQARSLLEVSTSAENDARYVQTVNGTGPDGTGNVVVSVVGAVNSVNGRDGDVTLTKSDVGLGNVDNTADADKPVSTATATSIAAVSSGLAASGGSALIGHISAGTGAVATTVRDKLRLLPLHPQEFGFVEGLAVSDAVAEANVTAAQACLDAAGVAGRPVAFDFQYGVFKDNGLRIPSGVHVYGRGIGYWNPVYPQNPKGWYGTNLIFKGSSGATTKYTVTGITSMRYAGGRREDPENPGEYFDLTSLMNADASGTTPATAKQLSVAITGKNDAVGWGLHGVRVVPWLGTDGVSDYSNESNTALSHPWDVGILVDDHEWTVIEQCQAVGHWRVFGGAIVSPGYTDWGHVERNVIRDCLFQGVTGFAIRGGDEWAVTAKTANTVTIRWSEESYWPTSGNFLGIAGNDVYTYSGTTRVGDSLRFDSVSPDPTVDNISFIRAVKVGTGIAGTQIENVICHGLEHEGGGDSESLGLPISKAFEMSGAVVRGVQAYNFKCHTPNERVIAFLHSVSDFFSDGWQVEGSQAHIIASPATSVSTATAPAGDSENIRIEAGVGFVDVKNALWTPRFQWRPGDQIAPRDELENMLLLKALSGQDAGFELATGKDFIIRNDDETALFSINEATGTAVLPGSLSLTGALNGSNSVRAGASSPFFWFGRSQFLSPADGQINARNFANNAYATVGVATPTSAEHAANKAYVDRSIYVLACDAPRISHTGTTSETTLATVAMPASTMGPNGFLRITTQWTVTNNANTKTPRVRLGGTGGTAFLSGSLTTSASTRSQIQIHNVNSASSQVSNTTAPTGAFGSTANAVMTGTVNTASAQDIVISGQLANSADTITLESYLIEVFYKA